MIGLSRLKSAISDVPPGGMQTGDQKVKLRLCDAQRIEVEYAALIAERDAALVQNAELVAQVEALRRALNDQLNDCINFDGGKLTDIIMRKSAEVLLETPQQHLRDIQAEAGRTGFVSGYERCWRDAVGSRVPEFVVPYLSEEYANRVKAGEA